MHTTFKDAYHEFKKLNVKHSNLGFATFKRYVRKDKRFKKPTRATDLCSYCEMGKDIHREIKSFIFEYSFKISTVN